MVAVVLILVIKVGHQRHLGEEIYELVIGIALLATHVNEIGNTVKELLHVLLTRLTFDTVIGIELGKHTALLQHKTCHLNGILALGIAGKALNHCGKELQFGERGLRHIERWLHRVGNDAPETGLALHCSLLHLLQGLVTDATRREVYYTFEGLLIVAVAYQAEIGNHILNLLALIEREATEDAVGIGAFPERLLEYTRLRIGAVQDCEITVLQSLGTAQLGNLVCHDLALLEVRVCRAEQQRVAVSTVREDRLLYLLAVTLNEAVGSLDNHLCRAVVLLELEYLRSLITLGKAEDIADIGTAERVDALRIVTHHAYCLTCLGQLPHDTALDIVGILELIDKQVSEAVDITVEHLGEILEKTVCIHQQVVKVHCIGKTAPLGIPLVYLVCRRDLGMEVITTQSLVVLIIMRGDKVALGRRDTLGHSIGLVDLLIELHLLDDALDKTSRIGLVVYSELRCIPYVMRLATQYLGEHRVEGTHPKHGCSTLTHTRGNTLLHLTRSLVGKGEGKDGPWLEAVFKQIGNLVCKYTGLARTGTGNYQLRPVKVTHGVKLCPVEFFFVVYHQCHGHKCPVIIYLRR